MIETAMLKGRSLIAACALVVGATAAANASSYTVTLQEVVTGSGTNVVATGSGTIDLTALTFQFLTFDQAQIVPSSAGIVTGPTSSTEVKEYIGSVSGPTSFGTGTDTLANSGSGDLVLFAAEPPNANSPFLVPLNYVSGAALSSTSTWDNATFASLGITPGTYTWTWGTGADQGSFTITTTPLPAALPLFATGLGFIGLAGLRRKRKAQAIA
jgi:hypothetical protein